MYDINVHKNGFHFRSIKSQDKELFMAIRAETSGVSAFYKAYPGFLDYNWDMILKDENELNMMVFQEPDELLVATCSFQRLQESTLELRYDVVKEFRGQGIGSKIVAVLIEIAHNTFPEREMFIIVRENNMASRRVAEKCGGVLIGFADAPEVETLQNIIGKIDNPSNVAKAKETIEQGNNSVYVYKV